MDLENFTVNSLCNKCSLSLPLAFIWSERCLFGVYGCEKKNPLIGFTFITSRWYAFLAVSVPCHSLRRHFCHCSAAGALPFLALPFCQITRKEDTQRRRFHQCLVSGALPYSIWLFPARTREIRSENILLLVHSLPFFALLPAKSRNKGDTLWGKFSFHLSNFKHELWSTSEGSNNISHLSNLFHSWHNLHSMAIACLRVRSPDIWETTFKCLSAEGLCEVSTRLWSSCSRKSSGNHVTTDVLHFSFQPRLF